MDSFFIFLFPLPMTRKDRRLYYWALTCLLLSTTSASAQNYDFDPVHIGESLGRTVENGNVTNTQFSSLQQAAIEGFLSKPETQTYLEKNFSPEGVFGELNSGAVVSDWETLAKAMGTTGAVLAGAYSLWKRRRTQELKSLRGGQSNAVEALFEKEFKASLNHPSRNGGERPLAQNDIPQSAEEWSAWAQSKGIPGTAASVAGLFWLWRKRLESKGGVARLAGLPAKEQRQWWQGLKDIRATAQASQKDVRARDRQAFNGFLKKLTRHRSLQEVETLLQSEGIAFNLERSIEAQAGQHPGYDVKRLLSGDIQLDEDPKQLFEPVGPPTRLSQEEGETLLSSIKDNQTAVAKLDRQLASDRALLPKIDQLISNHHQAIGLQQAVLTRNKSSKDRYLHHRNLWAHYYNLAYRFGSRHRRTGRLIPNRHYKRLALQNGYTAQRYVRNFQNYYRAQASISSAKQTIARYEHEKQELPSKIRHAEIQIEKLRIDIEGQKKRLASDPRAHLEALAAEKAKEIQERTLEFNRWIYARTRNGDYHEWWVNKGRHRHLRDQMVMDRHKKFIADIRQINAEYQPDLDRLHQQAETLEANHALAVKTRKAKVAEYLRLQTLLPTFNRARAFLKELGGTTSGSAYFSSLKSNLNENQNRQQTIKGLQQAPSPFAGQIAALQQQLIQKNELNKYEYVAKLDPQSQRHWKARRYAGLDNKLMVWRRNLLGNQNYWNLKLAKHMHAVASSRMDYSKSYEQTLRSLANKAIDSERKRLSGWNRLYREHPLVWAQKQGNWRRELDLLQRQQEEWIKTKDKQIAVLKLAQQKSVSRAFQTYNWLNQSAGERRQNRLTETIVEAEVNALKGLKTLTPQTAVKETQAKMAALAMVHEDQLQEQKSFIKTVDQIHKERFQGAVDGLVRQMKRFASPEGKARTSAIHDQESRAYWRRKAEDYNQQHGTGLSGDELSKAYHGIKSQTVKAAVDNLDIAANAIPVPENAVELVDQYQGRSSENPTSIEAFEVFMAKKNLRTSSENPENISRFKSLLASKSQAEQERLLHEATSIIQETRERAVSEATELIREAVTGGEINALQPPTQKSIESKVSRAFDRFIDEQIEKASAKAHVKQTTVRSLKIDPNHKGAMQINGDQLIISPTEKGLLNALIQNQITTNKEVLKVAANGIVLNGLELTVMAAEGLAKLLKIPSKARMSDTSMDPVYYLADQLDQAADKAQAEIDWYVNNVVHSDKLSSQENTVVYFASGMVSVGGIAKSVAKSLIDQSDQLIASLSKTGEELSTAIDRLVNPTNLETANGVPIEFTKKSDLPDNKVANTSRIETAKLDGTTVMSKVVQGIPEASLDRLKTRLAGLSDRAIKVQNIKAFGSRVTGIRSTTGLPFDPKASDVDIAVFVSDGKAFRRSERLKGILDEIEADFFSETGKRLELSVHSVDEIGSKTKFKVSDLKDF